MEAAGGDKAQRRAVILIARLIRMGSGHSCPISGIEALPGFRETLKALVARNLAYVDGDKVSLTVYGWALVCEIEPEIITRARRSE